MRMFPYALKAEEIKDNFFLAKFILGFCSHCCFQPCLILYQNSDWNNPLACFIFIFLILRYKYLRIKHMYTLYDINHSKISMTHPRVMEIKTKKRWNIIQLKNFCVKKNTINKVKRQT